MRKLQITLAVVAVVILSGFTYYGFHSGVAANSGKLDMSIPKLQSTEDKLKGLNIQYEKTNVQLKNQSSTDKEQIKKLQEEQQQNQKQQEELKAQLQAKAEQKQRLAQAAAEAENKLTATATVSAAPAYTPRALPAGSHTDWMAAAGIDPSNYGYVDYIVSHESGWNPNAVNASSGACGLGQQLPCGKWAGAWNDPIAALVAMNGYVGKFGGWAGAYNYWVSHGNY